MNYFLAPRGNPQSRANFEATIKRGVSYAHIEQHLSPEGQVLLKKEEVIYAWGNQSGNPAAAWRKMTAGDLVIFSSEKKLFMYAEVYHKEHSRDLALSMWPPDEKGDSWEYTFFLRNIRYVSIPMLTFNRSAGYLSGNYVQGFVRMDAEKADTISASYGSFRQFLELFSVESSEDAPLASDRLQVNLPDDIEIFYLTPGKIVPKVTQPKDLAKKTKPHKINYLKKNERDALTGSKGEQIVLTYEKDQLAKIDRQDLADKVQQVSNKDDRLGYDILSYEADGTPKYIEVKASAAHANIIRFFITPNELIFLKNTSQSQLYFVSGADTKLPTIMPLKDRILENALHISPSIYTVEGVFQD